MRTNYCRRALASIGIILTLAVTAFPQEFRATLTGNLSDPSGAAVPGATVTATNLQTNEQSVATTGEDGNYTLASLLPGTYSVSAEAAGFKRALNEAVELHVSDKATLDITMEVGEVAEVVTVNDFELLLEKDTATRGQVIENRRITELPLNGRNPIMLATLAPGVQFNGNPIFTRPFDNGDNAQFSINGGVQRHNEFLLDGAPNNAVTDADLARTRSSNNIAYVPPVDATQEFKVQTSSYDSQFGRTGGGIINVTIKNGGNEFHGTAYEFMRRYKLDANTFEANAARRPRFARDPVTDENLGGHLLDQYGGTFSGPIVRNRAFFFVAYERYRESNPQPRVTSVPTLLERMGDFSESGITIYDPLTTRPDPDDPGHFIRDPFPGNVIPAAGGAGCGVTRSCLNPIGLAIANAFPAPNTGAPGARFNNYIVSPNLETEKFYNFVVRGDANVGDNHHFFVRYVRNERNQFALGDNGLTGLGIDAQDPLVRANNGVAVDYVAILSPTIILNLRATYTRFVQAAFRTNSSPFDPTSIGFPESFSSIRPVSIVPRFQFEQYPNFGPRNPSQNTTNTISLQGNVSLVRGQHSYKVGGEVRDNRINMRGASFSWGGGQFLFDRRFTQQDPEVSDPGQSSAIAALLLGYPSGGTLDNLSQPGMRWKYWAGYIQDDWKVSRRLTVNLGLRYDYEAPPVERFNQQNRGFAFDQSSPLAAQISGRPGSEECPACADLRGGLLFTGADGQPEEAFEKDRNNFQPRIGVAFELDEKTVLRGGYGVYYFPQAEFGGTTGYTVSTPFVATVGGGAEQFIPANTLSNPFPNGATTPTGSSLGLLTEAGKDIIFSVPDHVTPKVHQFAFGVQRQLPGDFRLDVAYVGSRSVDILTNDFNIGNARNINVLSAEQLAQARQNPAFFNEAVANPFAGLLPGTGLNGPTIARRRLLLPFPQFGAVTQALENVGKIWYNSLQVSAERRVANGLTVIASYTWSKTIGALAFLNPQDAEPTRSLTDFDRPHVFVLSGVYQLPFGRDQYFAGDINRGWNLLVGGWEVNWIARLQSGIPIGYPGNVDLIGDPHLDTENFNQWFNTCVQQLDGTSRQPNATRSGFEPCANPAWAVRGPDTLRTIPFRSDRIREPTEPQIDLSLNKSFHFSERYRAQLRIEAFNVTNTPIFGGPNTDPNSTNFGFIFRGQRNFPRQIQLGFKFYF